MTPQLRPSLQSTNSPYFKAPSQSFERRERSAEAEAALQAEIRRNTKREREARRLARKETINA